MPQADETQAARQKARIDRINEISQLARTAWFSLLGYLVFVGITLLGVQDADFFVPSRRTELPLVGVEIPTASFFWTAPVLGAALYTYLHLFLIKLWDAHGAARTRDEDATHHWLVNDFVLIRQGDTVARRRPLAWLTVLITRLLVWMAGPLVLAYAWWRSMPAHDEWLTLLIAACLGVTLYVGFTSWSRAEAALRNREPAWWQGWRKVTATVVGSFLLLTVSWLRTEGGADHYVNRAIEVADAMLGTQILKDCAIYGVTGASTAGQVREECLFPNGDPKSLSVVQHDRVAAALWVPKLDWFTVTSERWPASIWLDEGETWNPLAVTDLESVELVELAGDWRSPETARIAFRKTWCEREGVPMAVCDHPASAERPEPATRLSARTAWCQMHEDVDRSQCLAGFEDMDARFESAWDEERTAALENLARLSLAGRDLRNVAARGASLVDADLTGARMEGANLIGARMEGANLIGARMEGAHLSEARMEGAYLGGARMEGANLIWARMEGADLIWARMEGADLSEARMEGAYLGGARMEGAYLGGAWMEGANLSGARMEGAYLGGAWMEGANLSGARMEGANLGGARMEGANLSWARMEGANLRYADLRNSQWAGASNRASPAHFADLRGAQDLTQAQLEELIGDDETLLPDVPAPDTGKPYVLWSCWQQPPLDLDDIVARAAGPGADDEERAALRADFVCGPDNPRRETGTRLSLDAPYPPGHPLADR